MQPLFLYSSWLPLGKNLSIAPIHTPIIYTSNDEQIKRLIYFASRPAKGLPINSYHVGLTRAGGGTAARIAAALGLTIAHRWPQGYRRSVQIPPLF